MAKRIDNFAELPVAEGKKLLLNLRHVDVKFNVRGRILNAIRDVSLHIYDGESLAIVGESGSGKSVLTKTFSGMLDSNGFISHGKILFSDDDLSKTSVKATKFQNWLFYKKFAKKLDKYSYYTRASDVYKQILDLKEEHQIKISLTPEEEKKYKKELKELEFNVTETFNLLNTLDRRLEEDKVRYVEVKKQFKELKKQYKKLSKEYKHLRLVKKHNVQKDHAYMKSYVASLLNLKNTRLAIILSARKETLTPEEIQRNDLLIKEALLSFGRYPMVTQMIYVSRLRKQFKQNLTAGVDISNKKKLDKMYEGITFRVDYIGTKEDGTLEGYTVVDCARVRHTTDWQRIRGRKIATVFQDPMTSLNPIITIGRQIMTVILKHQKCSEAEAKKRAIDIMGKVGIPDPETRFDDYPFQYSGGMRQRIVIAIALSCQPKILICDEPTTALDVTIQAQIIRLIKDLSKQLNFTTVYITHDLGVVANVADRVAVLYGGQIVELGDVEDIFYEPAHPYTWALLSAMPQLSEKGSDLFSISGTPPSLYNKIVGDAFAPRSQYAMAIDFVKEPPMFEINSHHWAKTWLLDDRSPKIAKPEAIQDLHKKMCKVYGVKEK